MSRKTEQDIPFIERKTAEREEGADFTSSAFSHLGESEWVDFEVDFVFPGEETEGDTLFGASKKSREAMLAETVALAEKLSGRKRHLSFSPAPAESDLALDMEDDMLRQEVFSQPQAGREISQERAEDLPQETSFALVEKNFKAHPVISKEALSTEKDSEIMAFGGFFAASFLSFLSLFLAFVMLEKERFLGRAGFCLFELASMLLLWASALFLKGRGSAEFSFRRGILIGFFAWEILFFLSFILFAVSLWQDQAFYRGGDKSSDAVLISFISSLLVFGLCSAFLRLAQWARGRAFEAGQAGIFFVALGMAGSACVLVHLFFCTLH